MSARSAFQSFALTALVLSVWNIDEKKCRLVEVKSPNDRLSETQKVWISVLLSARIDVEVCHVVDNPQPVIKRRKIARKKEHDYGDVSEELDEEEGGGDEDEFKYESGDEGKRDEGKLVRKAEVDALDDEENIMKRRRS